MGAATDRVVDQIVENRKTFETFCNSLSAEQLNRPVPNSSWIVRDFPAHLATLDPAMKQLFEATARGEQLKSPDGSAFDVDAYNEPLVQARRDWPLSRVFEEGAKERAELIVALRNITDEQTQGLMYFSGDAKRRAGQIPFGLFLSGWAWHDPIHAADMMRALPELHDDTELRAWLNNQYVGGYQKAMNPP